MATVRPFPGSARSSWVWPKRARNMIAARELHQMAVVRDGGPEPGGCRESSRSHGVLGHLGRLPSPLVTRGVRERPADQRTKATKSARNECGKPSVRASFCSSSGRWISSCRASPHQRLQSPHATIAATVPRGGAGVWGISEARSPEASTADSQAHPGDQPGEPRTWGLRQHEARPHSFGL